MSDLENFYGMAPAYRDTRLPEKRAKDALLTWVTTAANTGDTAELEREITALADELARLRAENEQASDALARWNKDYLEAAERADGLQALCERYRSALERIAKSEWGSLIATEALQPDTDREGEK